MFIPEEILTTAKECVRRFGSYSPTLFVQGTKSKMYMHLPFGETHTERVAIMIQAGIQLAQADKVGDVEWVIFVTEAWASPARTTRIQPSSQYPNRTPS